MKVAVAGVGAMGTRFALKLKQAGNDVTVVDGWDERVAALKQGGLRANLDGEEVAEMFRYMDKRRYRMTCTLMWFSFSPRVCNWNRWLRTCCQFLMMIRWPFA